MLPFITFVPFSLYLSLSFFLYAHAFEMELDLDTGWPLAKYFRQIRASILYTYIHSRSLILGQRVEDERVSKIYEVVCHSSKDREAKKREHVSKND